MTFFLAVVSVFVAVLICCNFCCCVSCCCFKLLLFLLLCCIAHSLWSAVFKFVRWLNSCTLRLYSQIVPGVHSLIGIISVIRTQVNHVCIFCSITHTAGVVFAKRTRSIYWYDWSCAPRLCLIFFHSIIFCVYTPKIIILFECNNVLPKAPSSSRPYVGLGLNILLCRFNNVVLYHLFKAKEEIVISNQIILIK